MSDDLISRQVAREGENGRNKSQVLVRSQRA